MNASRRAFVAQTIALGAALSGVGSARADAWPRATALTARFRLRYPIFQAPIGGAAGPELAAAVSTAGGMGAMPLWGVPPGEARTRVAAVRAATKNPFLVNYALHREPASLAAALDAGAPVLYFSWGMPAQAVVAAVRRSGAKFGIQVTGGEGARAALDLGAEFLVCQGTEAGGHVQGSRRLTDALAAVIAEARETPVVAAGGLARGADIRDVLAAGASAAMLGTRFLATRESRAHADYKAALLRADGGQTALTVCFERGWPNATHRVLRNGTLRRWEAAGSPPPGKRPGEDDVVATRADGQPILRYSILSPLQPMTGNVLDLALYCGEGVGAVRDIPPAGELVERLWKEATAS